MLPGCRAAVCSLIMKVVWICSHSPRHNYECAGMLMLMLNLNISAAVSAGLETLLIPQTSHLRTELHK